MVPGAAGATARADKKGKFIVETRFKSEAIVDAAEEKRYAPLVVVQIIGGILLVRKVALGRQWPIVSALEDKTRSDLRSDCCGLLFLWLRIGQTCFVARGC